MRKNRGWKTVVLFVVLTLIGLVYIILVLFIPYGIVGTWRLRRLDIQAGRKRLMNLFTGNRSQESPPDPPVS